MRTHPLGYVLDPLHRILSLLRFDAWLETRGGSAPVRPHRHVGPERPHDPHHQPSEREGETAPAAGSSVSTPAFRSRRSFRRRGPAHGHHEPCPSRGYAPADLREALVGPLERVQVDGVVQVERRIGEPDDPPARRGAP